MRWSDRIGVAWLGLALALGCTMTREYVGSELRATPAEQIVVGRSQRGDVLRHFGPPDRLLRYASGDVFVYQFERTNASRFQLTEPLVTKLVLFSWSKRQEKADRLTVFFDPEGVVVDFGFRFGTEELEAF